MAKACAAANLFLAVPLVFSTLDGREFGLWATMVSVTAVTGFLDFGIGNGSMNLMASANARNAPATVRDTFRTSFKLLCFVAAALLLLLTSGLVVVVLTEPGWASGVTESDVWPAALLILAVSISIPLGLGHRAQLAVGRGDRAFKWQAAGQLAALACLAMVWQTTPSLWGYVAASVLLPLAAAACNTIQVSSSLPPSYAGVGPTDTVPVRLILREGGLFFVLQLSAALAFSADLLLITWLVDADHAGEYAVPYRLFSIIPLALSLVWAPLWPLYRSALTTGDHAWVSRILTRSVLVACGFSLAASTTLIVAMDAVLALLAPGHPGASHVLLFGMATWALLEAAGTALATFMNSASVLKFQVISSTLFAASCVGGKAMVLAYGKVDLLPWVTVATYLAFSVAPLTIFWRRIWRESVRTTF